jgi:hypothetical protein
MAGILGKQCWCPGLQNFQSQIIICKSVDSSDVWYHNNNQIVQRHKPIELTWGMGSSMICSLYFIWWKQLSHEHYVISTRVGRIISIPSVFFKWVCIPATHTANTPAKWATELVYCSSPPGAPIATFQSVLWTLCFCFSGLNLLKYQYLDEIKWSVNSIFECKDLRSVRCLFSSICWAASQQNAKVTNCIKQIMRVLVLE